MITFDNSYFIATAPWSTRDGAVSFWIRSLDLITALAVIFSCFTFSMNEQRVVVFNSNNGTSKNIEYNYNTNNILGDDWVHVVITVTNNIPSMYIDGTLHPWVSTKSDDWSGQIMNGSIGGYDVINKGDSYSRGIFDMDIFRMFNRPLTADEITVLYNEGLTR